MNRIWFYVAVAAVTVATGRSAIADGDREQGARAFRACAACHSLRPGEHRTGPSLAGVFGRKAGSVETFTRYSKALKDSGVVWNAATLDHWIRNPKEMIPGNHMVFRGIAEKKTRDDLIAFLKSASEGKAKTAGGGHGGEMPNLKELAANNQVTAITYCKDGYQVTTAAGETHPFWEFNLRFKVNSGANGPAPGKPVLIPAGMMGDRAFVVFAAPDEISAFIKKGC